MLHDTVGFNYNYGYKFQASVTEGLYELTSEETKDYYKVIFIKTGPCHFLLNEKEFILTGSCAICMNEKDQIVFYDVQEEAAKILWFRPVVINESFNYDMMNNPNKLLSTNQNQDFYYLKQFSQETKPALKILSLHAIDSTAIEHKLQQLKDQLEKQNTSYWPCRSRSYLFEILICLARQEEDEEAVNNVLRYEGRSNLAVDVIYYLQSYYNQKITVERLAEEFHTNRTTLLNDFKKYTGQSINNYLIQLRLMMASTLLRDTELTVDEICERFGFSDISYFSKVFKKRIAYTPSEYRRITKLNT